MTTFEEYKAKIAVLKNELTKERRRCAPQVLKEIHKCIKEFEFDITDVFPESAKFRGRAAPKYFDPASGRTWSGRGRQPAWIRGKPRDLFCLPDSTKAAESDRETQVGLSNVLDNQKSTNAD
ncbi:H-NS histone family protein [Paraburkholderia acidicola]|nr:H-NS histone family protein [Paraburkholderia acidicola]